MSAADLRVRPAAVAGSFYPARARAVEAALADAFAHARPATDAPDTIGPVRWPKALVVPHAGWVYSGPVAASAYDRLRPGRGTVRRVVLLGPAHRVALHGIAVPTVDAFDTPLGPVPVDAAGRAAVLAHPSVVADDLPHAQEHSLEVHLPFLREVLGDVAVLPLVVGPTPADEVREVLDLAWGGDDTVVVVSSDLSHYHPYDEAVRLDRATARAVEDGRPDDIGPYDACGVYPLRGLLVAAGCRGLHPHLVDLRNSGDTAGPRDRVVGYGAFVVE